MSRTDFQLAMREERTATRLLLALAVGVALLLAAIVLLPLWLERGL